jgi:hypothetical protein
MAGAFLRAPTVAIGELMQAGSDWQMASKVATVIAFVILVSLATFPFHYFWIRLSEQKVHFAGQASHPQRLHQPAGAQKKKGNRAKKNKKARGVATTKFAPGVDAPSEEELEVVKVQSSSDVEAPSMRPTQEAFQETALDTSTQFESSLPYAQKPFSGSDADNDKLSIEADLEMCTDERAGEDTGEASEVAHGTVQEESCICERCLNPDVHIWGCPAHRIYTSSLLLMHCEMQRTIARGPPGLEPLPASVPSSRLCSLPIP